MTENDTSDYPAGGGEFLTSDGKGVFQWDNPNQSTFYIWGDQGPQYQIVNYADDVDFGLTGYFWTAEK